MASFVVVCGLVAAVASPLLEGAKLVFSPIYDATTNFFNLSSNLDALRTKMHDLGHLRDQGNQQVDVAVRNGGEATHQAVKWLNDALAFMGKADKIMGSSNTRPSGGCFFRCGLSRKVGKALKEVQILMEAYPSLLVITNRQDPVVEHIPVVSLEDQPTASQNLEKLMELLNRDGVRSIGVWGMGGVGKTTLLKNLNNRLCSLQSYGKVIWATVSKGMNHKRVQANIAQRLGFDLRDGDEVSMAAQLHKRISRENKFLLVLDDVWEHIDLDRLGIPQPQVHKGYKILLTTRSQAICMQMNMDEQLKVLTLNNNEALQLFNTTVGEVANSEEIAPYAKSIARECHGLPLAIKVVGAAMRRKERVELWKDALNELKRSRPSIRDIEKEVFNPLKLSYDSLQDETVKSCFLFCCLYPEDYKIDTCNQLVQCWVGEGLIDGFSYEDSLNRGIAILDTLKDACLVEYEGLYLTVHDMVRDVGIWTASALKEGPKSLILSGFGLSQVIEAVETSRPLKRMSLINNKIEKQPDDHFMLQSPDTLTLFLHDNEFTEENLEWFLQGFGGIRVLNLTDTGINSLPRSILQLGGLRTLLLNGCDHLRELPTSGWEGLMKLEVLNLSGTNVQELPMEVKMLIKLRELHLDDTKCLVSIPCGVFCMLSSLEVLKMEVSKFVWGLKEEVGDGKAYLEELENLKNLRMLCIIMEWRTTLNSQVNLSWISRLTAFQLIIGDEICMSRFDGVMRDLYIFNINFDAEEERIEYLLTSTKATCLWLHGCEGLDKMVQNLALNTGAPFLTLKSLYIWNCSFSPTRGCAGAQFDLLPNLEYVSVFLRGVESLSQLFSPLGLRFYKLRRLEVWDCEELKHILSLGGLIPNLAHLNEIDVADCSELEELFDYENTVMPDSPSVLPNLRRMKLSHLPKLRTVCKQTGDWPRIEDIKVSKCPQVRKVALTSENKSSVKEIRGEASWWSQLEWDDIATRDSLLPFFHHE